MSGETRPLIVIVEAAIDVTGGFVAAKRQARCLRGIADVALVIPADSRLPQAELSDFVEVHRLPIRSLRRTAGSALLYLPTLISAGRALARLMRSRGCDRLQVNDYYLPHGAIARLAGYRGTIVTWVRIDPTSHGAIGNLWLKIAKSASHALVTVSQHLAGKLPPGFGARIVYDPVIDAPLPGPQRRYSSRFVFFGNFIDGKGQDLAIRAFNRIAAEFPKAELAFYGSDMGLAKNRAYLRSLQAMAASSDHAARIRFEGFVDDAANVLNSAFAALNLSRSESFSLTCQEASAFGLPVIATRSGGPAEIIEDRVTGLLIRVGDEEAVASAMHWMLANREAAAAMGEAGAKLVRERFPVERFRRDLVDLFDLGQE